MSKQVEVIEVGPRDGFQSVKCTPITTEQKLTVIDQLVAAGVKHIEYTSFVSPKAIPQLADAADVTRVVLEKYPDMDLFALIPNLRGAQNAYELGLRRVCYVVSLSKSHNKANINRTHEQSLEAYKEIRAAYPDLDIIVDLATTFGCPFEGEIRQSLRRGKFSERLCGRRYEDLLPVRYYRHCRSRPGARSDRRREERISRSGSDGPLP